MMMMMMVMYCTVSVIARGGVSQDDKNMAAVGDDAPWDTARVRHSRWHSSPRKTHIEPFIKKVIRKARMFFMSWQDITCSLPV